MPLIPNKENYSLECVLWNISQFLWSPANKTISTSTHYTCYILHPCFHSNRWAVLSSVLTGGCKSCLFMAVCYSEVPSITDTIGNQYFISYSGGVPNSGAFGRLFPTCTYTIASRTCVLPQNMPQSHSQARRWGELETGNKASMTTVPALNM